MTADDLAELERLLEEYRAALRGTNFITKGKAYKALATELVRHVDALILAAKDVGWLESNLDAKNGRLFIGRRALRSLTEGSR